MSILATIWPALLGLLGIIGGAAFGWAHKQKTAVAIADKNAAQAGEEQANAALKRLTADQDADKAAQTAVTDAGAARAAIDAQVAATPAGDAADQLQADYARD